MSENIDVIVGAVRKALEGSELFNASFRRELREVTEPGDLGPRCAPGKGMTITIEIDGGADPQAERPIGPRMTRDELAEHHRLIGVDPDTSKAVLEEAFGPQAEPLKPSEIQEIEGAIRSGYPITARSVKPRPCPWCGKPNATGERDRLCEKCIAENRDPSGWTPQTPPTDCDDVVVGGAT